MRRKIPSLQALACFDAAARHESYTRAAQELALTQSAVSRQITALEEFLGIALFRRTRHGVVLTDAGSQYARQIAPRLQALERDTLDAMSGQGSGGVINLAAVPTFAARWLIPRLPAFLARHPDVVVHIDTRTRPFMFSDTDLDAAISAGTPQQTQQWAGTHALRLMPETVIPVAPNPPQGPHLSAQHWRRPACCSKARPDAWRRWPEVAGLAADVVAPAAPGLRLSSFMTAAAAVSA